MRGRALVLSLLLVATIPAHGAIAEWPLGPYGVFRLDVPTGWTAKLQSDARGGRAIAITPPQDIPLLLLVTPFTMPDSAPDTLLDDLARKVVAGLQSAAEEPALEARWFEGPMARGFAVSATDKRVAQPSAQNFKYVTQGSLVSGRGHATFTILTNLAGGPERDRALAIVRSAWHEPSAMPVPDQKGTVALALRDRTWRLLIDLPGFTFEPIQPVAQGRGVRLGGRDPSGVVLTAFLEPAVPGRTAVDYREELWARLQPTGSSTDVRRSERDGLALLERTVEGPAGLRIDQRHVNALAVNDGAWMDVHLSKVRYAPEDDARFETIIRTIRLAKKGIADVDYEAAVLRLEPTTALDYFGRANIYFRHGQYEKAIADLTEVINREPDFAGSYKGRALAYRRTGKPDPAIADYEQVIRLEPGYSLGYFGRGSLHQERGELDRAIADYDRVIGLDPKHALAFEQRARAFEQKGERDKAIADYRAVLALVPSGPANQRARDALARLGQKP